jgi:hypothetical protein
VLTWPFLLFQDVFAVAVSLVNGKILYISNQVASIFHCKRDAFSDAKFVEFLAPHDVSTFHSSTTPYKLPSWGMCGGVGEVLKVFVVEGRGGLVTGKGSGTSSQPHLCWR